MTAIRGSDTGPEMKLRRMLHALGYRYRLHSPQLPGKPDLVFAGRRKVIFVHGCFWHRHKCKRGCSTPRTRSEFWRAKFEQNQVRDRRALRAAQKAGWAALVVWECELTPQRAQLSLDRVIAFLNSRGSA